MVYLGHVDGALMWYVTYQMPDWLEAREYGVLHSAQSVMLVFNVLRGEFPRMQLSAVKFNDVLDLPIVKSFARVSANAQTQPAGNEASGLPRTNSTPTATS